MGSHSLPSSHSIHAVLSLSLPHRLPHTHLFWFLYIVGQRSECSEGAERRKKACPRGRGSLRWRERGRKAGWLECPNYSPPTQHTHTYIHTYIYHSSIYDLPWFFAFISRAYRDILINPQNHSLTHIYTHQYTPWGEKRLWQIVKKPPLPLPLPLLLLLLLPLLLFLFISRCTCMHSIK